MPAVAINVAANTALPGVRGPIHPDGSFSYVPIPEREPTRAPVPTYDDLDLPVELPGSILDRPVHLDPTFAGYARCESYTYGDDHGVKATPIGALSAGDFLCFYATLTPSRPPDRDWIAADWGAYVIGHFRLAFDPLVDAHEQGLTEEERERFADNAHLQREEMDARVLVAGDPDASRLYDVAVPLSDPDSGADPGDLVLTHTTDSGRGPWWRRPLRIPDPAPFLERVSGFTR